MDITLTTAVTGSGIATIVYKKIAQKECRSRGGVLDTIKREDAIKAIECRFNADLMDRIDAMLMTSAIAQITKNIANIPSADKQGEWIPCSERLPEYRKLVLVTTRDLRVKPAYLDSIQDDGTDDLWSIPLDDADCALWNIVAWMPLPEPWEGADDE